MEQKKFDSEKYISQFVFLQRGGGDNSYHLRVGGNLHTRELGIELLNGRGKVLEAYGYSLEKCLDSLLPLIVWEDYEKIRDKEFDEGYKIGYRDEAYYIFFCTAVNGAAPIRKFMIDLYSRKNEPPYEKLFRWVKENYAGKKELREKELYW